MELCFYLTNWLFPLVIDFGIFLLLLKSGSKVLSNMTRRLLLELTELTVSVLRAWECNLCEFLPQLSARVLHSDSRPQPDSHSDWKEQSFIR